MASIERRLERLEGQYAGTCRRCSGVVLVTNADGQRLNAERWQEYEAGCPVCGKMPPKVRVEWYDEPEDPDGN
jgi:hypothetical protein